MTTDLFAPVKPRAFEGLIGVARMDITPPAGIYSRYWGAARHDVARDIHQPLMLTCMTFQSSAGEKPLVLLALDLAVMGNAEDEWSFRKKMLDTLALPESHLMLCCSHTHSSAKVSKEDVDKPGGAYIEPYVASLLQSALTAVSNALSSAQRSVLTWQYGYCSLATNRDLPLQANDDFVVGYNPKAEADQTLLVGRVTDREGRITGTIVNYACHPTSLAWDNTLISPDYVGSMRGVVESLTHAPCLFLQGASGELSPAEQYSGDIAVAEKNGRQLGYAVMAVIEEMLSPGCELYYEGIVESGAALAVWKQRPATVPVTITAVLSGVPFPLKPLPALAEIDRQYAECKDRVLKDRLFRKRNIRKALGEGDTAQTPLWIWQLGDSLLFGQPNEAYSDFQLQLRKAFPGKAVAVMNLVNGGLGYLPPKELYTKKIYQEWQTPFAAGSLETLIAHATHVAAAL